MRKKITSLKTLLIAAGLCMGSSSAWADATILYGRAVTADVENGYTAWSASDIGKGEWVDANGVGSITSSGLNAALNSAGGGRSLVNSSISHSERAILTYDIVWDNGSSYGNDGNYTYLSIGSGIQFRAYSQAQKGEIIIGGTTIAVSNACGKNNGNRDGDVWTIHMVVNTGSNKITELTISGNKGNTKVSYNLAGPTSIGSATYTSMTLGWVRASSANFTTTLQSVRISEEVSTETYVDYTVNYTYNGETIKTDNGTAAVDAIINAENPVVIGGVKYYAKEGEVTSMTIINSTNVLDVDLRMAKTYNYSVNAVDESNNVLGIIASGTVTEGEALSINYSQYYLSNGTLLKADNSGTNSHWTKSYTPNEDNCVYSITYKASGSIENVVYFTEAEKLEGITVLTANNAGIRCSNAAAGYAASEDIVLTTLQPGIYKISAQAFSPQSAGGRITFNVGKDITFDSGNANTTMHTSEAFTLTEATDVVLKQGGGNRNGTDFIYIQKTADILVSTEQLEGYKTFYNATKSFEVDANTTIYKAAQVSGDKVVITAVEGKIIPAGQAVILKTTATDYAITLTETTTASADDFSDNALQAAASAGVLSGAYILAYTDADGLGFYEFTGSLDAGDVYVTAAGAAKLRISVEDEMATAIQAIATEDVKSNMIYNLNGQRVVKPLKGIYIQNGKKILVK